MSSVSVDCTTYSCVIASHIWRGLGWEDFPCGRLSSCYFCSGSSGTTSCLPSSARYTGGAVTTTVAALQLWKESPVPPQALRSQIVQPLARLVLLAPLQSLQETVVKPNNKLKSRLYFVEYEFVPEHRSQSKGDGGKNVIFKEFSLQNQYLNSDQVLTCVLKNIHLMMIQ